MQTSEGICNTCPCIGHSREGGVFVNSGGFISKEGRVHLIGVWLPVGGLGRAALVTVVGTPTTSLPGNHANDINNNNYYD